MQRKRIEPIEVSLDLETQKVAIKLMGRVLLAVVHAGETDDER